MLEAYTSVGSVELEEVSRPQHEMLVPPSFAVEGSVAGGELGARFCSHKMLGAEFDAWRIHLFCCLPSPLVAYLLFFEPVSL